MKIFYLKWDSEFFGIKTGKADIYADSQFDPTEFKRAADADAYNLIYIFNHNSFSDISLFNNAGLALAEIKVKISRKFPGLSEYQDTNYQLKNSLTENELVECYKIAAETSSVSRFSQESLVGPDKTKDLYRKWVDNALNKTYSDGIFIEKVNSEVAGINIVKTDLKTKTGYCGLIGVNEKFKSRGIGRTLWKQSFAYWAEMQNIETVKTAFSLQNMASFNFHLKLGFNTIDEIVYIYHYSNNPKLR